MASGLAWDASTKNSCEARLKLFGFTLKERASLVAQIVKNLPSMRETRVQTLDWKDFLEEGVAAHSSTLGEFHGQRNLVGSSP